MELNNEIWNAMSKTGAIIATSNKEKGAWKMLGAKNQSQRNELLTAGFKVVKEISKISLTNAAEPASLITVS